MYALRSSMKLCFGSRILYASFCCLSKWWVYSVSKETHRKLIEIKPLGGSQMQRCYRLQLLIWTIRLPGGVPNPLTPATLYTSVDSQFTPIIKRSFPPYQPIERFWFSHCAFLPLSCRQRFLHWFWTFFLFTAQFCLFPLDESLRVLLSRF